MTFQKHPKNIFFEKKDTQYGNKTICPCKILALYQEELQKRGSSFELLEATEGT